MLEDINIDLKALRVIDIADTHGGGHIVTFKSSNQDNVSLTLPTIYSVVEEGIDYVVVGILNKSDDTSLICFPNDDEPSHQRVYTYVVHNDLLIDVSIDVLDKGPMFLENKNLNTSSIDSIC